MPNGALLRTRLGQYGLAWLVAFVAVLGLSLGAHLLIHIDLVRALDMVLPVAFAGVGAAMAAFLAATLAARQSAVTKTVLVALGLILTLPLLWAPVLGAIVAAKLGHATLEYSSAYATFRILVGKLIFPATQAVFHGAVLDTIWTAFERFAIFIGFIAAVNQLWPLLTRGRAREQSAA
jgi:hypothetical protein